MKGKLHDIPKLRNRVHVFRDRADAGRVLAGMLERYRASNAIVMAVPAGGVAVGVAIARELILSLDVAVVSKITFSWNTEAGYGAIAFDGTVMLNEEYLSRFNLSKEEIEGGIKRTKEKVARRTEMFRGDRPLPDFTRPVVLVDDWLASGFTLRVAIKALRNAGSQNLILSVPTAHSESCQVVLKEVEALYCANLRSGFSFAVADAYEQWSDLSEQDVMELLQGSQNPNLCPHSL